MPFSSIMREAADPQFKIFLKRPFLTELAAGKLPLTKFRYYIMQDNLYLEDAAVARRIMLNNASPRLRTELSRLLKSMNRFELFSRRTAVSRKLGVTASMMRRVHRSPTTLAYTSFIIRTTATASIEESLAAMMACPWTYAEMGERYAKSPAMNHPIFGPWLGIYQSQAMNGWLEELKGIIDRRMTAAKPRIRRRSKHLFVTGCKFECMFWDMAYRMEKWLY